MLSPDCPPRSTLNGVLGNDRRFPPRPRPGWCLEPPRLRRDESPDGRLAVGVGRCHRGSDVSLEVAQPRRCSNVAVGRHAVFDLISCWGLSISCAAPWSWFAPSENDESLLRGTRPFRSSGRQSCRCSAMPNSKNSIRDLHEVGVGHRDWLLVDLAPVRSATPFTCKALVTAMDLLSPDRFCVVVPPCSRSAQRLCFQGGCIM